MKWYWCSSKFRYCFQKKEECAKRKIIDCLYNMAIAYKEGSQNQKPNTKNFFSM